MTRPSQINRPGSVDKIGPIRMNAGDSKNLKLRNNFIDIIVIRSIKMCVYDRQRADLTLRNMH